MSPPLFLPFLSPFFSPSRPSINYIINSSAPSHFPRTGVLPATPVFISSTPVLQIPAHQRIFSAPTHFQRTNSKMNSFYLSLPCLLGSSKFRGSTAVLRSILKNSIILNTSAVLPQNLLDLHSLSPNLVMKIIA